MSLDNYYFETDTNFTTSHDFKVAKILANDLLQLYLENQLVLLENKEDKFKSYINKNNGKNTSGYFLYDNKGKKGDEIKTKSKNKLSIHKMQYF